MARNQLPDHLIDLPEAAKILGVHRATVNDMVRSGRLRGRRRGGRWVVEREVLADFAATYQRPSNAPPRRGTHVSANGWDVLDQLNEWGSASVMELAVAVDLHEGNIRKQLALLQAEGYVERQDDGQWVPVACRVPRAAGSAA